MEAAHKIPEMQTSCNGRAFDVARIREDFPILKRKVHGKPLVYLDSAATGQKPQAVLDVERHYYEMENANVHRGVHHLSEVATNHYEGSRAKIRDFLGAASEREIIFVRGATEGINLVAQSYGRSTLRAGDEIIISTMEHHSNIVPWQILCEQTGAKLRVIPIDNDGVLYLEQYERLLNHKTKMVALVHVSNALGTINPIREMIAMAHRWDTPVLIDGAQAAPHTRVNVQELDADFYTLSGHKLFASTGIGVLYGKSKWLESMPPYQGGGDMISLVTFEKTHYNVLPYKFEAGTPHIAGAISLGAAVDYLNGIGMEAIDAYEQELLAYGTEALTAIEGVELIGTAKHKAAVLSFTIAGVHPHDIGTILDREGIAIRAGHHCAMPVMQRFGVPATARASLAFYNTTQEIDALAAAVRRVQEVFA